MRKYIFLILISIFISCNNSNSKKEDSKNKYDTKGNTERINIKISSERNLERDFNIYLNSMLIGDMSKAFRYTHEISMNLLKKKYSKYKNRESLVAFFENTFKKAHVGETNKSLNMRFIPSNIYGGVIYKETKIYCIKYYKIGSNSTDKVNLESNVIAISNNNGKDWKFIEYDKPNQNKFIDLLSKYYPRKIVSQAFNKKDSSVKIIIPQEIKTSKLSEINLLRDVNKYCEYLQKSNTKEALKYIEPEVFNYLQETYHPKKMKSEIINLFNGKLNSTFKSALDGFNSTFINDRFLSFEKYNNNLLYVVHFYLFGRKESDYYSFSGEYVAISNNNGQTWKFIAMSDLTHTILERKFPIFIVNKLLKHQNN